MDSLCRYIAVGVLLLAAAGPVRAETVAQARSAATLPLAEPSASAARGASPSDLEPGPADDIERAYPRGPSGDPIAGSGLVPRNGHRSEIERAWFSGGPSLRSRASQARRRALELGARNASGVARALIAEGGDELGLAEATLGVRLAPDLPLAHVALARVYWNEGQRTHAIFQIGHGVMAIGRHLESSLWLGGSVILMVAVVLVTSALIFMVWVGISLFSHVAHDLGDLVPGRMSSFARTALLGALLLVPLIAGEGLAGLVIPLFAIAFAYGGGRHRMALALSAVLLVIGLFPLTRIAGTALTALAADPVATATLSVLDGNSSANEEAMLRDVEANDNLARYAMAVRARREGRIDDARRRYASLLREFPRDPVVLANAGNLHFLAGEIAPAIDLYERAAAADESATLMFNLSQAYARAFRMDDFERTLQRAQSLDPETVVELSRNGDPNLVADLPLPIAPIRNRMLTQADGERLTDAFRRALAPGRLGDSPMVLVAAFLLPALLSLLLAGRFEHSSICTRCGVRICARCDGTMWNNEICDGCHHLFHRPESTDSARRLSRLAELRKREALRGRIGVVASVLVPGVGGLIARRPDLSFLGILFFAAAAVFFVWHDGVVPDPLAVGAAGPIAFVTTGFIALLAYAGVVTSAILIRRNQ